MKIFKRVTVLTDTVTVMKKTIFILIFLLIPLDAFSSDLILKCKSSFFSSISLVQKGETYYLDGVKYPDYTEEVNSAGWLWAKVRVSRIRGNNLELLMATKNVKIDFISKVEFFVLDLENYSFKRGVEKNKRKRLGESLSDWIGSSSGNCKEVETRG